MTGRTHPTAALYSPPMDDAHSLVAAAARAANAAAPSLARADDATLDRALGAIAARLSAAAPAILEANREDLATATANGLGRGLIDRLRLDDERLRHIAEQLATLAAVPHPEPSRVVRSLPDGLRLEEHRKPVGVIGANFEARPNVTVDVASQLLKSRNGGVLRTGAAALRSSIALFDAAIAPGLGDAGLDAAALQLIRTTDREAAVALVCQPGLIPLVILRGSGESTRALGRAAAQHGVRTLAHADGGGVLYIDAGADAAVALRLVAAGLDRLGVCNRLNLLLVDDRVYEALLPSLLQALEQLGVAASLPPHAHPRGHEWALTDGKEATVTIDRARGPRDAARIANEDTSRLAATICTSDAAAARAFMDEYRGTAVLWNATTRLIDGFKLLAIPETGINVEHVPGPRGPVTFRDLYLKQYVVIPA
jgi:glutamate-5-semialdehyde dehydrogenase